MNLTVIKNVVTSKVARQVLLGKKHSPVLMFGAGIVGGIGTVVFACNATLKLETVVEDAENQRAKIRAFEHSEYSEMDRKKDHLYLNVQTAAKICRLYAPAIGLGVVSVGLLTGSHVTLSRRNAGLTAAYAALNRGFNEYRDRVREEVGEEKERELRYNVETIQERIDDTKKGEVNVKELRAIRGNGLSGYARLFDDTTSKEWNRDPQVNMFYIKCQERYANDRLKARGHVLLNDVYDALGLDRTKEGCVVGWVYGGGDEDEIDFGLFRRDNMEQIHSFMVGRESAIWLDFNVDGVVYDLIGGSNG